MVLTNCVICFSQYGVGLRTIRTWHDTQCHNAFWIFVNCPTLLFFSRSTHNNSVSLYPASAKHV